MEQACEPHDGRWAAPGWRAHAGCTGLQSAEQVLEAVAPKAVENAFIEADGPEVGEARLKKAYKGHGKAEIALQHGDACPPFRKTEYAEPAAMCQQYTC